MNLKLAQFGELFKNTLQRIFRDIRMNMKLIPGCNIIQDQHSRCHKKNVDSHVPGNLLDSKFRV